MGASYSEGQSYDGNNHMSVLPYVGLTPVPREEIFLQSVPILDLVRDAPAVFLLVRRPGCNMCREAASDLAAMKANFARMGVRLFAVVHERKGVNGFAQFFRGDGIFLDERKDMFTRVLGGHTKSLLSALFGNAMANSDRASSRGFKGDNKGTYDLMGGLVVIGAGATGVTYLFNEKEFGDHAPIGDVLAAASRVGRGAAVAPSPYASLSPRSYAKPQTMPASPYGTQAIARSPSYGYRFPTAAPMTSYPASPMYQSQAPVYSFAPTSPAYSTSMPSYSFSSPLSPSYMPASPSFAAYGGVPGTYVPAAAPAPVETSDCGEEACAMPRRR